MRKIRWGTAVVMAFAAGSAGCGGGDEASDSGAGDESKSSGSQPALAQVKEAVSTGLPGCEPMKEDPQTGTVAPENVIVYCANGALVFGYERFDSEADRKSGFTQADDSHATFTAGGVVVEFSDADGDLKTFEEDDPRKGLELAKQVSETCGCGEAHPGS
jgi:hypothetical protein